MTDEIVPVDIMAIAKIIETTLKDIQKEMNELVALEQKVGMSLDVAKKQLTDEADALMMTWKSFYDDEAKAKVAKEQEEHDGNKSS